MVVDYLAMLYWRVQDGLGAEPVLSRVKESISSQAPKQDHQLSTLDHGEPPILRRTTYWKRPAAKGGRM